MRSSTETYSEVAKRCSAFEKISRPNKMSNMANDEVSCLTCTHFSDNEYCKLDLYDPIVRKL